LRSDYSTIGDMKGRWMLDRREGGSARRINSMV
jgi:hypothetical protein